MSEDLPAGWKKVRLEDVCEPGAPIMYGILQPGPDQPQGVPYVRPTEIVGDRIDLSEVRRTTPEIAEQYRRSTIQDGDVLLSIVGTIGKVAVVPPELNGANITQSSVRIRPGATVTSAFLAESLRAPHLRSQFDQKRLGTGVPRLNVGDVRVLDILLPPLPEQRRIVAKLDVLQSKSRRAKEALDAIPPLLERFRQSVLAAAFRGDLTADWRAKNPDVEPASELLKRIRIERRRRWEEAELAKMTAKGKTPGDDRWKAKYVEPEPVDTEGLPELPAGWCWSSVEQLFDISYGLSEALTGAPTDPTPGHVAVLRIPNIATNGTLDLADLRYFPLVPEKLRPLLLEQGDVLFNWRNAPGWIGKSAVFNVAGLFVNASFLLRLRPALLGYSDCVAMYFNHLRASGFFLTRVMNAVNQANFNGGLTGAVPVPLIPLPEQLVIGEILMRRTLDVAHLQQHVATQRVALANLDRAILAKAFRGELVPQDPSEASSLPPTPSSPATSDSPRVRKQRARR